MGRSPKAWGVAVGRSALLTCYRTAAAETSSDLQLPPRGQIAVSQLSLFLQVHWKMGYCILSHRLYYLAYVKAKCKEAAIHPLPPSV